MQSDIQRRGVGGFSEGGALFDFVQPGGSEKRARGKAWLTRWS
jgi:hypothetical protein